MAPTLFRLLCFLPAFVAGCASPGLRPQLLTLPPQPIAIAGHAVLPPNEAGWIRTPTPPEKLVIGRRGELPDETFVIDASPIPLQPFNSPQELLGQVKSLNTARLSPADRFRILEHEVHAERRRPHDCVLTYLVAEDKLAVKRTTPVPGLMILEVSALTCAVPGDRAQGITVAYSRRYNKEHRNPAFRQAAEGLLATVSPLPPQ